MNSIEGIVIPPGAELPPNPNQKQKPDLEQATEVSEIALGDSTPVSLPDQSLITETVHDTNPPPEPPRRGRHPNDCKCGRCKQSKANPSFNDLQQPTERDFETEAGAFFDLATSVLASSIGPEWIARSPEEKLMVVKPLAAYLKTRPQADVPPGVLLCFVIAAYSAPRCQEENTKTKLKALWNWCLDCFHWIKLKCFE